MNPMAVVIDTNWVLDLFVFHDPRASALHHALESGAVQWLVCPPMRDELERVLTYPAVVKYMARTARDAQTVLAAFDQWARPQERAADCGLRCKDPDDQVFIDLAYAHQATLLSKDAAVLRLRKRLAIAGARASDVWPAPAPPADHSYQN